MQRNESLLTLKKLSGERIRAPLLNVFDIWYVDEHEHESALCTGSRLTIHPSR